MGVLITHTRRSAALGLLFALSLNAGCDFIDDLLKQKPKQGPSPLAQVAELTGTVTVQRGPQVAPATQGLSLYTGDLIATAAASTAKLRYQNGTEISVQENTRFRLGEKGGKLSLVLEEGVILSKGGTGGSGTGPGKLGLLILTPEGESEIKQGSEVTFELHGGKSKIGVAFGDVEVIGQNGESTVINANETLELALAKKRGAADAGTAAVAQGPTPLELEIVSEKGVPLLKGKDDRSFKPAPKEAAPLPAGTTFRVSKISRALVTSGTFKLRLMPGAVGRVEEATALAGAQHFPVEFEAGSAELALGQGARQQVELTSTRGPPLSVSAADEARAEVAKLPRGHRITVRSGVVELKSGELTQALKAGEIAEFNGKEFKLSELAKPELVLPTGRKMRVYADALQSVGLMVPEGAEKGRVQVANDPEFSDVVFTSAITGDVVAVDPPTLGELYWRFLGPNQEVITKGQARFEPDHGRSSMDETNPTAEVAESGQKATVFFQSALPALHFSFPAKQGAKQYRVRVYRASNPNEAIVERMVETTSCTLEAGKIGEGEYLWYAAPLDENDNEMAGGRMNKLELVYDNSRKTLAITKPRAGERVGKDVATQGVAPIGSKLFINGKQVPLDEKGRFTAQLPRADALVYRLVTDSGDAYWIRPLRRGP